MPGGILTRKITAANLFDCADLSTFIASIVHILSFRGSSTSRFYTCEVDGVQFLVKLCFYRKTSPELYGSVTQPPDDEGVSEGEPHAPKALAIVSHTDAEIGILKLLNRKITDANLSPCILELIYYKVCHGLNRITPKAKICDRLMLEYNETSAADEVDKLICQYVDLVRSGLAYDKCAFLVLDRCDMTLDDYLRKSVITPAGLAVFKSLLFQVIYTLYVIHQLYPRFHHYDLHTDNIMLKFDANYTFKASSPRFLVFHVGKDTYSVPYFGIIPKIIDYGFSVLPEEGIMSNIIEDRVQMHLRAQNDILFLFHNIRMTLAQSGGDKLEPFDKILRQLDPSKAYVHYNAAYIRKIEGRIPTYSDMVKNRFWDEYRMYHAPESQIYNEFASAPVEK